MGIGLDMLYAAGLAATSPIWGYRMLRTGKWRTDWRGRFGRCNVPAHEGATVLIHAVSVGEVNAVRLLVEQLAQQRPDLRIVISSTTNTGIARAKQLFEPHHAVVRFPLDFSGAVSQFLDSVKPDVVALAELEVWPNFVRACVKRGAKVCVINGRLSARSFKRYRLVAGVLRSTFAALEQVGVQTQDYAQRFIAMGAAPDRVQITDTMKWDTAQIADTVDGADELARAMGIDPNRALIVAGSTGPGEEKMLMDRCPPKVQLMVVPRKPERFAKVAQLSPYIVQRTEHPDGTTRPLDNARFFLLDTMGELRKAYSLADVVLVGRSFLGMYGSDPMEPVALCKPVIIGTHHSDFADTVAALSENEGIIITDNPGEAAQQLLEDPERGARLAENGRQVILSRQGATQRHAEMIMRLLPAALPAGT